MDEGEAIGSALDPGQPVIQGEDYRVPVTVWLVFEESDPSQTPHLPTERLAGLLG